MGALLAKLKHVKGAVVVVAGVGAVLSGLVGYWTTYQTVKVGVPPTAASARADSAALSIVVLPFADRTGDPQQAYFADGITETLTTDLSRIQDAVVIASTTAFTYRDKSATAIQIGKDLGVRFVLQGSVQRSGNRIRINAQLADATSNAQLWSETFDGDQSNLFALQDLITTRIANSIGREMIITAGRESEKRRSSPKVADLILRARALDLKPRSLKNLEQTEAWYRQALAVEPNNTMAMVGLARSLALEAGNFGFSMDERVREKKFLEGRDLALKVKELDPQNPGIFMPIGQYARTHDDFPGYRRAAETLLSLQPKSSAAHINLAISYLDSGEPKKAIELLTQAINLDPKHPPDIALLNMGRAYFMLGDNDAAIEWYLKTLEASPAQANTYAWLAMAYALKGDEAKAQAAVADLHRTQPNFKLSEFRKPQSSSPAAYKEYFEKRYLPAGRKAGLPE